uniref:Uncharacterized protein n=1 Tax=Caulobacter sp. (strain K31) TaxID=366602 RepID=B0SYQ8_CAUSK
MRLALLLPVLLSVAAPAYADGARESRYGPTTPRQAAVAAVATARYDGPMLGWANKRQVSTAPVATTTPLPTNPAPLANWAGYRAPPAPPAYAPAPVPTGPISASQARPTSLYAAPRPPPATSVPVAAAPAPAKDWSSYRSSRVANVATAPAPAPAPPRQLAAANTGGTSARFYSVGRDYGLTPDAVPPAGPDTRVLITATEPPPEPRDAAPVHGSADWLAAGVTGDDDNDDAGDRRAKTRNQAR